MYAVVGCTECGGYWLLADPDDQDTANCPTCGRTHQTANLKRFYTSDDRQAAVEIRSRLLAEKRGETEQFETVADAAELERAVESGTGLDDREYLDRSGVDPDAVGEAGDVSSGGSRSREEIVRAGVAERDDRESAVSYATDHGVPREAAADLLDRLLRRGEATDAGEGIRLL
ncbi:MAG: hypothetical protein J07HB67_02662 [halophilic archaeon J07HB67]|jgi:hypothetical protein|nr:MAG: hypothetical protein J07HB67_02662 [halophilic archaeon J07HB67]